MLVAFPIALYVATVVTLIAHAGTHDIFWYRVALWANLGGVVMAAVAAVPGLIDLLSLPAKSRARTTGLRHAGFNVLSLALFAISAVLLYRGYRGLTFQIAAPLVLGLLGLLSTVTAGWLGWTLVQTHHVGIKPTQVGLHRDPRTVDDLDELDQAQAWPSNYVETFRTTIRH